MHWKFGSVLQGIPFCVLVNVFCHMNLGECRSSKSRPRGMEPYPQGTNRCSEEKRDVGLPKWLTFQRGYAHFLYVWWVKLLRHILRMAES